MFMLFLIIVLIVVVLACIKIVPQSQEWIVERLGKYHKTLKAGVNFILPGLDKVVNKVSLKEHVHDFSPQPVITKDNVTLMIDSVIYCKIINSQKVTYEISNPINAIDKLTSTTLRNLVGDKTLDELLTAREEINAKMLQIIDDITDPWGIDITRVEIQSINQPAQIQEAMEKQMKAERDKRATILQAEAQKEKQIAEAEGKKQALLLEAEAKAESILKVARAEAEAIRLVNEQNPGDGYIKIEAIKSLKDLAKGENVKFFLPSDITEITKNLFNK